MKASTSPDPWPDPSAALEKAIGEYEEKNRQLIHGKDGRLFTRKRKLSFGDCIFQMVGRRGKTQQAEADVVAGENGIGTLTASGLFNRRMAIDPSAVSEISKSLVRGLYLDPAVWKSLKKVRGKILVACDGSDIVLPSPKGNAEKYGTSCGGRAHSSENDPVMGKLSTLYDVMNGFTVETETGKYKKDEKKMLMDHIESLSSWLHRKFVFVCDRGYFSIEIADFMAQRHLFYVIRLNGKTLSDYWGGIEPGKDMVCGVRYSGPRLNNVKKSHPGIAYRVASTVYRIRFVRLRIQKADGTYAEEVLATNLPRSGFSVSDIAEIYRERWGIENSYRRMKSSLKMEQFSGYRERLFLQDIHATVIAHNMTVLAEKKAEIVKPPKKGHMLCFKRAAAEIKLRLWKMRKEKEEQATLLLRICTFTEPVRPGRSYPRRNVKNKCRMSYADSY